jgi:hypothetical protein
VRIPEVGGDVNGEKEEKTKNKKRNNFQTSRWLMGKNLQCGVITS